MDREQEVRPLRSDIPIVATVIIERFADGTYSAFAPLGDGQAMGLARGGLAGALSFAKERLRVAE